MAVQQDLHRMTLCVSSFRNFSSFSLLSAFFSPVPAAADAAVTESRRRSVSFAAYCQNHHRTVVAITFEGLKTIYYATVLLPTFIDNRRKSFIKIKKLLANWRETPT